MEKCSLCVQRIQAGKAAARRDGRPLADGEVQTACQQACPTQAIVFGDLADPQSAVSRRLGSARAYAVLEELNVQPSVRYLADVRHASVQGGPDHG
jgi:molybdopterin-containing oxidoreductase family iron-sulfur binding subunit